ncbi:MAG TPA: hypothetical protein VIB47_08790 [Dehalococcoidia bacterium]
MRFVLAVATLVAVLVAACGGGDEAQDVSVSLKEWSVTPSLAQVTDGKVKFTVTNDGTIPHEFVVIKSDLPPNGLPVSDGKVIEDEVNLVDEIEAFAAKSTESITLDLSPGKYLLICNVTEQVPGQPVTSHYQNGMTVLFLVEPE